MRNLMTLTKHDAYAFRRILCKMDIPEGLDLSPIAKLLIDTLDPMNNATGWNTLKDMLSRDLTITEQVLFIDPNSPPPREEADHTYVEAYIQQAISQTQIAAPDTTRTNGSTDMLLKLYESNQQGGPQAAQQTLQQQRSTIQDFNSVLSDDFIEYLDKDKIVQAREVTAVVGQPAAGKSFWTLAKLAEIADTAPVLYITAEGINPERLHALVEMRKQSGIQHSKLFVENFQFCRTPIDFTSDADVENLIRNLGDFKPQVVAIDTFAACTPGIDENSSKDVQPVLNRIREYFIERLGCAVLLIHHTTKDGKSFRGSSALRGNVANMYYLVQDDELIILRSDKQRDSEADNDRFYRLVKFATRVNPKTGEQIYSAVMLSAEKVIDDPKVTKKLPRNQRTILGTLNNFDNGLTTRSLQDATDISKSTLWRSLQKLSKAGYIKTGEKGEPVYITEKGRELLS